MTTAYLPSTSTRELPFNQMELKTRILRSCQRYESNMAVFYGSEYYTYKKLGSEIAELTEWLSVVDKKIPVMIKPGKRPVYVALMAACVNLGLVTIPYDNSNWYGSAATPLAASNDLYLITADELPDSYISACQLSTFRSLKLLVLSRKHLSTGSMQAGVSLRLNTLRNNTTCTAYNEDAFTAAGFWNNQVTNDDVFYCMDIYNDWMTFYFSMIPVIISGATLVIHSGSDTPLNIINRCVNHSATILIASLEVYEMILAEENFHYDFSCIRIPVSTEAPFFNKICMAWKRKFGRPILKLNLPESNNLYHGRRLHT